MARAPRRVEVTWLDASRGDDGTDSAPQRTFGIIRRTMGWLVREQKAGVLVAMSKDQDAGYERWFSIPRAYVMTIKDVREVTDGEPSDVPADRGGSGSG